MDFGFFTPTEADVAAATGAGLFVSLIVTRQFGLVTAISGLAVSQLTSFYVLIPYMMLRMWSMGWYRPAGFLTGAFGMLIWGAALALAEKLKSDPTGTVDWLWRLWKGQGGER